MKFRFAYREYLQFKFVLTRNTLQRLYIYYKTIGSFVNTYLENMLDSNSDPCYFLVVAIVLLNPYKRAV